ncbi:MAG TPA: hypothetical protein EYH22_03550 [Candidatus Nanopusillus sp.]|nr:hypothetical protein [Candidatus Nanopusillus sp.]
MGVLTTLVKAFFIAISFWIAAIIWTLYFIPLAKYSLYLILDKTVYDIWGDTYPEAIDSIKEKTNDLIWFIEHVPNLLLVLGGVLSGVYLFTSWARLRYRYDQYT